MWFIYIYISGVCTPTMLSRPLIYEWEVEERRDKGDSHTLQGVDHIPLYCIVTHSGIGYVAAMCLQFHFSCEHQVHQESED